jgi:hypothetical protein
VGRTTSFRSPEAVNVCLYAFGLIAQLPQRGAPQLNESRDSKTREFDMLFGNQSRHVPDQMTKRHRQGTNSYNAG